MLSRHTCLSCFLSFTSDFARRACPAVCGFQRSTAAAEAAVALLPNPCRFRRLLAVRSIANTNDVDSRAEAGGLLADLVDERRIVQLATLLRRDVWPLALKVHGSYLMVVKQRDGEKRDGV